MSGKGTCTGCGASRDITKTGVVYRHNGPDRRPCPGSARFPEEAGVAPAMVAVVLDRLIENLPVRHLPGQGAVVLLADLNTAIYDARREAGALPLRATDG